jgi:hypothetical protein
VTVGRIEDSSVLLGLWPNATALPASDNDFVVEATLGSFTVKGTDAPVDASNFKLAAFNLGKIILKDEQLDNGGAEFGVAAVSFASLVIDSSDPLQADYKWPNVDEPAGPTGLGDLALRLVTVD